MLKTEFSFDRYVRGRRPYAPGVPLSQSYVCFRCGKPGHFIRNCPTNGVSGGKLTLELYESECEILQGSVVLISASQSAVEPN